MSGDQSPYSWNEADGLDVVEPGVIPIQQWRPEAAPAEPLADVNTFGGIGRKR